MQVQISTWGSLHTDIQGQLPLGMPELKALSLVNKHWRKFSLKQMLVYSSENRLPLEAMGFTQSTGTKILQEYGNSLRYLSTTKWDSRNFVKLCSNLQHYSMRYCIHQIFDLINFVNDINKHVSSLKISLFRIPFGLQTLIQHCTNLTSLDLEGSDLIGEMGDIGLFTKLTNLSLNNVKIFNFDRIGFRGLIALGNRLTSLDLTECGLADHHIAEISASMLVLKTLKISKNFNLTDASVTCITLGPLTALTELAIGRISRISFSGYSIICTRLLNLNSLSFFDDNYDRKLRPPMFNIASFLTDLTHLDLSYCELPEEDIQSLARMSQLTSLNLRWPEINEDHIKILSTLSRLRFLEFRHEMTIQNCILFPSLETLDIFGTKIDRVNMMYMANSLKRLTSLNIDISNDDEFSFIVEKLTSLTSLKCFTNNVSHKKSLEITKLWKEKGLNIITH